MISRPLRPGATRYGGGVGYSGTDGTRSRRSGSLGSEGLDIDGMASGGAAGVIVVSDPRSRMPTCSLTKVEGCTSNEAYPTGGIGLSSGLIQPSTFGGC